MKTLLKLHLSFVTFCCIIFMGFSQGPTYNFQGDGMFLGNGIEKKCDSSKNPFLSLIRFAFRFKEDSISATDTILEGDIVAIIPGTFSSGSIKLYLQDFKDSPRTNFDSTKSYFERYDDSHLIVRMHAEIFKHSTKPDYSGGFCIVVETLDPGIHSGIQFLQFIPTKPGNWDRRLPVNTKSDLEAIHTLEQRAMNCSIQPIKIPSRRICPKTK